MHGAAQRRREEVIKVVLVIVLINKMEFTYIVLHYIDLNYGSVF